MVDEPRRDPIMMSQASPRARSRSQIAKPTAVIPTMLSDDELGFFRTVAESYQGTGSILEIGPWLGGSTAAICRGLQASGHKWSLVSFDRFRWSASYAKAFPGIDLQPDQTTLPLVRSHLAQYLPNISLIEGDILNIAQILPLSEKIELVFIDGAESWRALWRLFNHIGPWLAPDARIVIRDVLHISGRQAAWFLSAIPQLRLTKLTADGSVAVFSAAEPVIDLARDVAPDFRDFASARLTEIWHDLSEELPETISQRLAVGLALDLLDRDEQHLACAILDQAVRESPNLPLILSDLARLLRKVTGAPRMRLLQVVAYLRAGAAPEGVLRAARLVSAGQQDAASPEVVDVREATLGAARILAAPQSVPAMALRHAAYHGFVSPANFRSLFLALQSGAKLGLPAFVEDFQSLLPGANVVELQGGAPALNSLVLRAFGAASYTGVLDPGDWDRRSYRSPVTTLRVKSAFSPADLEKLDRGVTFVQDLTEVPLGSADIVLIRPERSLAALDDAFRTASQLLKPGGHLRLNWRNTRSWSGHGRAPQTAAEINLQDPEQVKLVDWLHVGAGNKSVPKLQQIREHIEARFRIESWFEELDDPEALIRMSPRILKRHASLSLPDLICRNVFITLSI